MDKIKIDFNKYNNKNLELPHTGKSSNKIIIIIIESLQKFNFINKLKRPFTCVNNCMDSPFGLLIGIRSSSNFGIRTNRFRIKNLLYFSTTSSQTENNNNNIKSAIVYINADIQKLAILKDNKGKSGIYLWKNENNGKLYVGSSQDLARRLKQYYNFNFLTKYSNMNINKALLKYGYSSFSLYILEYCDGSTKENIIKREQYYIDLLKPEYNILKIAGSSLGFKHTEESLAKMIGEKKSYVRKKRS